MLGSIISGIGTAYNIFSNERANKQNQANYKETMAWQKQENEITRQREDNAIQRRMADLKASGINPIIAGGGGADVSSGGITPVQHYEKDESSGQMIANLVSQKAQLENINAQTKVAEAQAENVNAQTAKIEEETKGYEGSRKNVNADTALKEVQKASTEMKRLIDEHDYGILKGTDIRSNTNGIVGQIVDAINVIKNTGELEGAEVVSSIDKIMEMGEEIGQIADERRREVADKVAKEIEVMSKDMEEWNQKVLNDWYTKSKTDKYNPIAWAVRQTKGYKEWEKKQNHGASGTW